MAVVTDSPDYTLLADVNIIGSVTLNVNIAASAVTLPISIQSSAVTLNVSIVESIRLDVNIVASQITLNVNVQAQVVDLKIYTPSGRWATVSETVSSFHRVVGVSVPGGETVELIRIPATGTARGRLMSLSFVIESTTIPPASVYGNVYVIIEADGAKVFEASPGTVDYMNGGVCWELIRATTHALSTGLSLPVESSRVSTNPDRYAIRARHVNPAGGLTTVIWDYTNSKCSKCGGYLNMSVEFFQTLSIKVRNQDTYSVYVYMQAIVGGYP